MKPMGKKRRMYKCLALPLFVALVLGIGCLAAGMALAAGELTLSMTASPTTVSAAGEQINITYTVWNNGPDPVADLTIALSVGGGGVGSTTNNNLGLQPTNSTNLTATYTVTAQDIQNGGISFTALATGETEGGDPVSCTGSAFFDVDVTVIQNPSLGMSASAPAFGGVGESVAVTYTVTNTGNTNLANVALTDVTPSGGTVSGGASDLAPGASANFTVTYTNFITQAHVDAGTISFSARAVGAPPVGAAVAATATASASGPAAAPGLSLIVLTPPAAFTGTGQAVATAYQVTNTGNITIDGVALAEVAPTGATVSGGAPTLAPNESASFTVTYTTAQADVEAGAINFSARAAGTSKQGQAVTTAAVAASASGPAAAPSATLALTARPTVYGWAGQNITLTFTVTNTGNVTLTGLAGLLTAPGSQAVTFAPATLAPGAMATGTVTYTVTQANASDRKALTFSGAASATAPSGTGIAIPAASVTVGYQPSDDATLRSVLGRRIGESRRSGTQSNPKRATVYVRHSVRTLRHADWEANHPRAWISFGSAWNALDNINMPLEVGKNDVLVCVTAESNARLFYRITIWRADADGKYTDVDQSPTPAPATLLVNGSVVPVSVSSDGGLIIPLTALLLDGLTAPVAINPAQFGAITYVALDIPNAWFDETGRRPRFDITGMGMIEINDRMLETLTLTGSTVRLIIRKGQLEVTLNQGGVPLAWDNARNPMLIGVPFTPEAGTRLLGVALYQDQGVLEPKRVMPRSWYKDGFVYGYVSQNGRYAAANILTEPVTDYWGAELSDAAYALLARGVLDGLPKAEAFKEGVFGAEVLGWYLDTDPVTHAEFMDMLALALDMEWEELLRPDEQITRQEMMLLAYDAMIGMNALPAAPEIAYLNPLVDWEGVDEDAQEAIHFLTSLGIVESQALRPTATATLGEAVHLLNEVLRYGQILFEEK